MQHSTTDRYWFEIRSIHAPNEACTVHASVRVRETSHQSELEVGQQILTKICRCKRTQRISRRFLITISFRICRGFLFLVSLSDISTVIIIHSPAVSIQRFWNSCWIRQQKRWTPSMVTVERRFMCPYVNSRSGVSRCSSSTTATSTYR